MTEAAADPSPQATHTRFDCTDASDADAISAAAEAAREAISRGECVVLPTDTVYGIGADAFDAAAVQRLLDAKGRGRDMPPPVLIADTRLLRALATAVPADARVLVAAFWPGPLTVICKAQPSLRMDLGETDGTIALRVPDHDLARELLRKTGPMAVSSANLSGRPAALDCDAAVDMLGDSVAVYLDGGTLGGGESAPSTIVDFSTSEHGRILRRGALSLAELREHCPELEDLVEVAPPEAPTAADPHAVPSRQRHTLQPPPLTTAVDDELAAEDLQDADDVRAAIEGVATGAPADPDEDTSTPEEPNRPDDPQAG